MNFDRPFVSIVGPTATGKTKLAVATAEELLKAHAYSGIDLISADSRQVYKGLEILSGADIPVGYNQQIKAELAYPFYTSPDTNIAFHGLSIIAPDEEWSVSHFRELAMNVVEYSLSNSHLPIFVGGTGLYHRHIFNNDPRLQVQPNNKIRAKAASMTLTQLQDWASLANFNRFDQLNQSDRSNPRRLIRIIEVAQQPTSQVSVSESEQSKQMYIGLTADLSAIEQRISTRVRERFEDGAVEEVNKLLISGARKMPAASSLGVSEITAFLDKQISEEECIDLWSLHEFQYAKRQLTWWKKEPVKWFSVLEPDWLDQAKKAIVHLVDPILPA